MLAWPCYGPAQRRCPRRPPPAHRSRQPSRRAHSTSTAGRRAPTALRVRRMPKGFRRAFLVRCMMRSRGAGTRANSSCDVTLRVRSCADSSSYLCFRGRDDSFRGAEGGANTCDAGLAGPTASGAGRVLDRSVSPSNVNLADSACWCCQWARPCCHVASRCLVL